VWYEEVSPEIVLVLGEAAKWEIPNYKPYVYPHPLQDEKTWEGLMKSRRRA
jgi:hypothetical protein